MEVSRDVIALQRLQPRWNTSQMSTHGHWDTSLARACLFLTSLWTLINSRGSPFAQGGRRTSASLVPFCLAPEGRRQKRHNKDKYWYFELWEVGRSNISGLCPLLTQIKVVGIEQELRQVEELWYKLFDVGHIVFGGRKPGFTHTVEHPVCQVKMTSLAFTRAHGKINRFMGSQQRLYVDVDLLLWNKG